VTTQPSPELRSRILEALEREPAPTRAAGRRRRARALVLGFGALLGALAVMGPKIHHRSPGYVAVLVFTWLFVAALATWAGVAPGRSMLGRPAAFRVAVIVLTPVAMMSGWAVAALIWPSMLHDTSTASRHLICDVVTFLLAIGPLFAFGFVRRGSDPVNPALTGAAIGTASGAWAAVVLHLVCGYTSAFHILVGHVAPVLGIALVGSVLTARTVAIRAKTG
jgi:hypothetical protein